MNPSDLRELLQKHPKRKLVSAPTPIDHCSRLSETYGARIQIKRDDLTGLATGGNKTRQLEYVLGAHDLSDVDVVLSSAFSQSNWCRQLAAAAAKLGVRSHFVLAKGLKNLESQGNLLINKLIGATVEIVDGTDEELLPLLIERAEQYEAKGVKAKVISAFSDEVQALAALGYVEAAIEIVESLGDEIPDWIYVAGADVTPAGLVLGMNLMGLHTKVVTVSPIRYSFRGEDACTKIANDAAGLLGVNVRFAPGDFLFTYDYVGDGYGIPSTGGLNAMRTLANTEGILLDPVYTGKAMHALLDHLTTGVLANGDKVVFLHTGGIPGLFAYADETAAYLNMTA